MPLEFEPGQEAQVDWHEGWIFENGVERQVSVLRDAIVLFQGDVRASSRRPISNRSWTATCGLSNTSAELPRRLAYVHFKVCVIYVGLGQERVSQLCSQRNCGGAAIVREQRLRKRGRGNEKGDVENGCKRSERTICRLSPAWTA